MVLVNDRFMISLLSKPIRQSVRPVITRTGLVPSSISAESIGVVRFDAAQFIEWYIRRSRRRLPTVMVNCNVQPP
ncbi:MAG: hypothetical protein A3H32_07845 [Betaproteobacteria bacterium RIFCSPLOWO2_02_FULL_63_19]|nr:MAG: hypothetical protein A3H32_07845 [Betaproteobacteria bacterium RIFCSPLOWO2_02_FULL_63_19]